MAERLNHLKQNFPFLLKIKLGEAASITTLHLAGHKPRQGAARQDKALTKSLLLCYLFTLLFKETPNTQPLQYQHSQP